MKKLSTLCLAALVTTGLAPAAVATTASAEQLRQIVNGEVATLDTAPRVAQTTPDPAPRAAADDNAAVAPVGERLLDTREDGQERLTAGEERRVSMADAGVSPGDIVAVNITAVQPDGPGWMAAYTSAEYSDTSNLNYAGADIVAGVAYVPVPEDLTLKVKTLVGSHLVVDVVSVMDATMATAIMPWRAKDTRKDATSVPHFTAEKPLVIEATGKGVPVGAKAAIVNLTSVEAPAAGWVELNGTAGAAGATSALNYTAGQVVANNAIVPLNADGTFTINTMNATHLVVDVMGYVAADSPMQLVKGQRILDSRQSIPAWVREDKDVANAAGDVKGSNRMVRAAGSDIAAAFDMPTGSIDAIIANITITDPAGPGYASVWEGFYLPTQAEERPVYDAATVGTSLVNYTAGQNVANGAVISLDTLSAFNVFSMREAGLIVDVVGYVKRDAEMVSTPWSPNPEYAMSERTSAPVRVGPGSTVTFATTPSRGFDARNFVAFDDNPDSPLLFDGCFSRTAGVVSEGLSEFSLDNRFSFGASDVDGTRNADGVFGTPPTTFALNIDDQISGDFTCRVGTFDMGDPRELVNLIQTVDLSISSDAPAAQVTVADLDMTVETGGVMSSDVVFGPGDTIEITGAPIKTYGSDTEFTLAYPADYYLPYKPALDGYHHRWTAAQPLAGQATTSQIIGDGTGVRVKLPNDPALYTEFAKQNQFDSVLVVSSEAGDGRGRVNMSIDAFSGQ